MLNKYTTLFISLLSIAINHAEASSPTNESKAINSLLSKMTLEEKVGQMTNLTLEAVSNKNDNPVTLDMAKLRNAIVTHNVGSVQNAITHAYTLQEWHYITNTIQDIALKETRLKIPNLYEIDAVHGANNTIGSTLFPHNLALAATRNPELARRAAEITAKEVRASGIRLPDELFDRRRLPQRGA